MSSRLITHVYLDPIDAIWLQLVREIGWRVERSSEVYASTDGKGVLQLGTAETLDPDDCTAQMIFHEVCHASVQGELGRAPDWGLDNTSERDVEREHGCLRLQAALADGHGLRTLLAPTTEFRPYYDALGPSPLVGSERAAALARSGEAWLASRAWADRLDEALASTARIAAVVQAFRVADHEDRPVLWTRFASPTKGARATE